MSAKKVIVPSLIIAACIAVIVLSSFVSVRPLSMFSPFRAREPFAPFVFGREAWGRIGPFGWHLAGWRGIASAVAAYSFLYLASLLALFAFPRHLRIVRDALGRGINEGFRLFGIGVLYGLALLFLTALGLFTFVASPLSLLLLAALLLAVWLGLMGLALAIGRGINRVAGLAQSSPIFDLALGTLVFFALGCIPIAGWVIVALLGTLGAGAAIATRFGAGGAWSLADFNVSGEGGSHE